MEDDHSELSIHNVARAVLISIIIICHASPAANIQD